MYFISFLIDHTSMVKFHYCFYQLIYLVVLGSFSCIMQYLVPSTGIEPRRSALGAESQPLNYQVSPCQLLQNQLCIMYGRFHGGSDDKESACNAGGPGLIPALGRSPGEGNGNLLQDSWLENFLWRISIGRISQRSLTGYSP